MSDIADKAQEQMERLHQHMITNSVREVPTPTGFCLYCDERVDDGKLFCDKDCHEGYEYEQSVRAKQRAPVDFFEGYRGPGFAGEVREEEAD